MAEEARRRLVVIAHAPSPNTAALRDAVLKGAGENEAIDLRAVPPLEAGPDDVRAADALILGTPENLGYMSGALKDFFDRSYYPCLESTRGLPFALYIRAGEDGTGTRRAVTEPLILRGQFDPAFIEQAEELGRLMGAGVEAGIF